MDWSLVLASQGIENTISHQPPTIDSPPGWSLVVPAQDVERALEAIHLYQLENRRWPWRQRVLSPGLVFDWTSLLWVVLVCLFYFINELHPDLRSAAIMNGAQVGAGQWWRLFTAIWLHGDASHLAGNATLGLVLLGLSMGRYGPGLASLASYLAGIAGNLVVWVFSSPGQSSLGASGMVMGSLGLLAAQSFTLRPRTPHETKYLLTGFLGGLLLFILLGLDPESDVRAHLGGFIGGVVLGAVLSFLPNPMRKHRLNLGAALLLVLMIILPWYFAFHSLN
jgi:membrane associated rhomboid family serine protease